MPVCGQRRERRAVGHWLCTVGLLLLAGLAGAGVLPPAGRSVSPPQAGSFIDVKRSFGTSDIAIRRAIASGRSTHRALYFAAGTYRHRGVLVLDGLTAFGDGPSSVLVAENPARSAVVLTGTKPVLRDIQLASSRPSERLQASAGAGVRVYGAEGFVVQRVTVTGAASAGIIVIGGANGLIADNSVAGALADGIHITAGSRAIQVSGNTVHDVGDDMIAVVSYLTDRSPCSDILIAGNRVQRQSSGRGITAVGGRNVTIRQNTITATDGAGVLVAADRTYGTYGTDGVKVLDNVIDTTDLGHIGHAGILLVGQPGSIVRGTVVDGNVIRNTRSHGISVGGYTQSTTLAENRVSNVANTGILLEGARDVTVTGNTVARVDASGIYATRSVAGRLVIDSNTLVDVNRARGAATYVIRIESNAALTYGEVVGNSYSGPAGYPYQGLVDPGGPSILVSGNRVVA